MPFHAAATIPRGCNGLEGVWRTTVRAAELESLVFLSSRSCPLLTVVNGLLTSAIHTKVKSSLIMRLTCGNTLKSIWGAAPFGCGAHQAFPQVIRGTRSRS